MGKFAKGEVVVFPFPFSDLSQNKVRPCLVVADLSGNDMILCMITKNPADPDAIKLETSDFAKGNLPVSPCYIRPSRLFTGEDALVVQSNGNLKTAKLNEVTTKVVEIVKR